MGAWTYEAGDEASICGNANPPSKGNPRQMVSAVRFSSKAVTVAGKPIQVSLEL